MTTVAPASEDTRPELSDLFARRPGWIFHGFLGFFVVLWLCGLSGVDGTTGIVTSFAVFGLLMTFLAWVTRFGCWLLVSRKCSWSWLVLPLVLVIAWNVAAHDGPSRVRFHFSESAFDRAAATYDPSSA